VQFLKHVYIYSALCTDAASFCDISTMTYQNKRCHKAENSNITVAFPRRFCFHIFYRHKMGSPEHWLDIREEAEVAGSEVWRVGWVLKHSDVFISY